MRSFKSRVLNPLMIAGVAGIMAVSSVAQAAGDLTRRPHKLPDLVMGSDDSDYYLSQKEYQLETGKAYKLAIISNGQKEYAMVAPDFFASIYLRKVEAGGMEIKAVSLTELEFEDAAEAEIYFVPIKSGEFEFEMEGLEHKGMTGVFKVK